MTDARPSLIDRCLDWLFRPRSLVVVMVRAGVTLATLGFGSGIGLELIYPSDQGPLTLRLDSGGASVLLLGTGLFGLVLIAIGLVWEWLIQSRAAKRLEKKRVLVVEVRGLRDTRGTPLSAAVPAAIEGHRESLLIDLRQQRDGTMVDPETAVQRISLLPRDLQMRLAEGDRSDNTLVYGGLAPVPLTFLTGVLVDDETAVTVMDWDRHSDRWRPLDAEDDLQRFDTLGLQHVAAGTSRVALAVSVSYHIDLPRIGEAIPEMPLVELRLQDGGSEAHWSQEKQAALAKQFFDVVVTLANRGVSEIHMFLAAPNSLVFTFGRRYDKRNLPRVIVYQYEKGHAIAYPWGIRMPVTGNGAAQVVLVGG